MFSPLENLEAPTASASQGTDTERANFTLHPPQTLVETFSSGGEVRGKKRFSCTYCAPASVWKSARARV